MLGLPLPDVVGAAAVRELGRHDGSPIGWFIKSMLDDPPKLGTLSEGARILV
jgi:hypothetical protein